MNTSKIHKSNDYSKFHFIDGNRPIANRKTGLEKSIEAIGYYGHAFPSVVMSYKKKLYILDGQHRYMEAQKRDEAFYYVLVNDISMKKARELIIHWNNAPKSWAIKDYLCSFIDLGYKDYIALDKFSKENNIDISTSIALLSGYGQRSSQMNKDFKSGAFEVKALSKAKEIANHLNDIRPFAPKIYRSREFVNVISALTSCRQYDKKRMVTKLEYQSDKLEAKFTQKQYIYMLDEIYNCRVSDKNYMSLMDLYERYLRSRKSLLRENEKEAA